MSVSSETQQPHSDFEIQRGQASSLETLVPIPDFFYDIKAEIEPIGGSTWRIRLLAYMLYFLTTCTLFTSFAYYSLPAQRVRLESLVTSEWQIPSYVCKPLQRTTINGLSTDWTFDQCMNNVANPSADSVEAVRKSDGSTQFDFKFASGGSISLYDDRLESSILQTNWQLDGHSCWPEAPFDNTFNVGYNYTECLLAMLPPSLDSLKEFSSQPRNHYYYPFGFDKPCYLRDLKINPADLGVYSRIINLGGSSAGADNNPTAPFYCVFGLSTSFWDTLMTQQDQFGGFGAELVCSTMKSNGNGFRCFSKPTPPATKELAIEQYASEYPREKICAPLKLNSPFECTKDVEVPATTRLSLSVASAQAVFSLVGIILVVLLRKLQVPSKSVKSVSGDEDIRSVVRNLQLAVDQLRISQGTQDEFVQ